MFMTDVNDVKIYNLSAGKSLPEVSINCRSRSALTSLTRCSVSIAVVDRSTAPKIAQQISGFEKEN